MEAFSEEEEEEEEEIEEEEHTLSDDNKTVQSRLSLASVHSNKSVQSRLSLASVHSNKTVQSRLSLASLHSLQLSMSIKDGMLIDDGLPSPIYLRHSIVPSRPMSCSMSRPTSRIPGMSRPTSRLPPPSIRFHHRSSLLNSYQNPIDEEEATGLLSEKPILSKKSTEITAPDSTLENSDNNNNKENNDESPDTDQYDFYRNYYLSDQDVFQRIEEKLFLIWDTVTRKSTWKPLAYILVNNVLQIPNIAWNSYLQLSLRISPATIGSMNVLATLMAFVGIIIYKLYFLNVSWRVIYFCCVLIGSFFSCLQIILIFQWNFTYLHIPTNLPFILGDTVIGAAIGGMQYLPCCILYARLCPEGSEGTSYAILTTFANLTTLMGRNLGNVFGHFWNVSNDAMREHDYDGLWKLTVLTSLIQVLPLCVLFLLPKNAEEVDRLVENQERSKAFGIGFLAFIFAGIIWIFSTVLYEIFYVAI
jgi:hypothetical protein